VREACEELASDFACDFALLPEEVALDFSSSRFARVPPDGLTGSVASSLSFAPPAIILARGPAGSGVDRGLRLLEERKEKERLCGAGIAHRRGECGRKDGRSTVGRAHAHVKTPLSARTNW
jgi:hypothetical protein